MSILNPELGEWMTVEEIAAAVVWPVAEVRTLVDQMTNQHPYLIAKNLPGYPGARVRERIVPEALGIDRKRWESQRRFWIAAKLSNTKMRAKPVPRSLVSASTARQVEEFLREDKGRLDRLMYGR